MHQVIYHIKCKKSCWFITCSILQEDKTKNPTVTAGRFDKQEAIVKHLTLKFFSSGTFCTYMLKRYVTIVIVAKNAEWLGLGNPQQNKFTHLDGQCIMKQVWNCYHSAYVPFVSWQFLAYWSQMTYFDRWKCIHCLGKWAHVLMSTSPFP